MLTPRDCTFQSIQSTQESLAQASFTSQQPPVHCPAADEIFFSFLAHDGTRPGEKYKLCLVHRKLQQTTSQRELSLTNPKGSFESKNRRALRSQEHLQQVLPRPSRGAVVALLKSRHSAAQENTVCYPGGLAMCPSLLMLLVSGTLSYLRDRRDLHRPRNGSDCFFVPMVPCRIPSNN